MYERAEAPGHARGRFYRRAVRATVGVLTALLWVGPLAFAGPGGGCSFPNPLDRRDWKPQWQSIPAPDYPAGPRSVVSYASSAVPLSGRLLVTNGVTVMSSTDFGCTWKQSFSLASLPGSFTYSSSDSQIVEVVASRLSDQVAFIVVEQLRPVSRVHVAVTYNWGTSWESADQGLETALGSVIGFAPSPTNSEVAYLSAGDGASGSALFVTEDGGSSWSPRRTKAGGLDVGIGGVTPDPRVDNYTGVTVDPSLYTELWLPSVAGLYHSANGGRTLVQNPGVPAAANIGVVDVFHWNSTYPAWIRAFSATDASGYGSNDGGATFTPFATPGIVQSASNVINRPETVIATSQGVFVVAETMPPPNNVWNISSKRRVVDVQAEVPLGLTTEDTWYTVYAHTNDSIERFTGVRSLGDPDELLTLSGLVPGEIDIPPPHLSPRHRRIELERGETRTIDYDLVIPNSPDPLDVYFLVDISGSMQDAINGIRAALQDIYDQLNDSKINVYFGVGEFRSYTDDPAYHRILPISAPDARVSDALNSLNAEGGGEETQTEALYQAATGEGRDFFEAVPVGLPVKRIAAGQEAGFRPDWVNPLKVILMVTDEEFSEGGDHRPYPETIDALSSRNIFQLGLAIQEGPRGAEGTPRYGLNRVAKGTDSVAPEGGVDCDGNGSIDLAEGVPLVCVIDPQRAEEASLMAPAIVNLLLAVDDPATVEIEPVDLQSRGALEVVKSISPPIPGVNFKEPNRLDFDVTYRCPRLGKDKAFDVTLQAVHDNMPFKTQSGDPLTTTTRVVCRAPIPEPEPRDPVAEALLAIVLPPIAPPPPRPPDIVTNPNPQPQGQAQANAALAAEKEQQPQLALAHQGKAEEVAAAAKAEEKYAMSSYTDRDKDRGVPPEAVLMIGAASMCMMFGCATLAQQRARTQQVRR